MLHLLDRASSTRQLSSSRAEPYPRLRPFGCRVKLSSAQLIQLLARIADEQKRLKLVNRSYGVRPAVTDEIQGDTASRGR